MVQPRARRARHELVGKRVLGGDGVLRDPRDRTDGYMPFLGGGRREKPHLPRVQVGLRFSSNGASRDRTGDLLLAKQALSQLSYGPRIPLGTVGPTALG